MGKTLYFSKIIMDNSLYEKFQDNKVYINFWEDEVLTEEEIRDKFIDSMTINDMIKGSTFENYCSEWGYQNLENLVTDGDYITHNLDDDKILVVLVRYC